ncbi:MAG: hypothetical protein ACK5LY_08240, partial [Lachnospirales bacterium]
MFTLIKAFYDIFFGKRPEGYEDSFSVKHYTLREELNNFDSEYKSICFYPTNAHDDVEFDQILLYLGNKFLRKHLCLVEITALGWRVKYEEKDDWWKEEFPYEYYEFLKMYDLDKDFFYNGTDKIACLKDGVDVYFIDKFFCFHHGADTSDHMLHMYIPVSENISIDSYKDISNIIKSKQFKFRVEV